MSEKNYADMINKLLRKAESTTPEEAEALFAKAQELMVKYAIDEAMLNAAKGKQREKDDIIAFEMVSVSMYRYAIGEMKWRVAQANGARVIKLAEPEIGRASCRERV